MELEGIMLSAVSQSEKDKQCMFSFIHLSILSNSLKFYILGTAFFSLLENKH